MRQSCIYMQWGMMELLTFINYYLKFCGRINYRTCCIYMFCIFLCIIIA